MVVATIDPSTLLPQCLQFRAQESPVTEKVGKLLEEEKWRVLYFVKLGAKKDTFLGLRTKTPELTSSRRSFLFFFQMDSGVRSAMAALARAFWLLNIFRYDVTASVASLLLAGQGAYAMPHQLWRLLFSSSRDAL